MPQSSLLNFFKSSNYKHHMVGKETSEEPNSGWIRREMIGKAKCSGRPENWLFLGD